jgi:hypothetical protein
MGTIDKYWVRLSCNHCGASETSVASEKGSAWGSSWESLDAFTKFETTLSGGGYEPPDIISAICKTCHQSAMIFNEFGMNRPAKF